MSSPKSDCPYGAEACPKVEGMERAISDLVAQMRRTNLYLGFILGIIAVEFGYVII